MQGLKKTKIHFIITKGLWGGASNYIYQIAKNLPKDHFDIKVISGRGDILKKKLQEIDVETYQIEEMDRDINLKSEIKSFIKIYQILKKDKPDIIHLNSPKASGIGAFTGRILGIKKIITTIHGFTFKEKRGVIENGIIKILSWIFMKLSHKNIIISKSDLKEALKMPFLDKKIIYIPNGIDIETKFTDKEIARKYLTEKLNLTEDDFIWIGTIAELHKNKGLKYGLEALKNIENAKWFICGEGEERKYIEKYIHKNKLEKKVFLLGFEDSIKVIKAFDIFMLPSIKEGLPYVILEAGLAKVPTIASRVGGIPDILEENQTGLLFEKENPDKIYEVLNKIIKDKNIQKKISENLYNKILENFSLKENIKKISDLYLR